MALTAERIRNSDFDIKEASQIEELNLFLEDIDETPIDLSIFGNLQKLKLVISGSVSPLPLLLAASAQLSRLDLHGVDLTTKSSSVFDSLVNLKELNLRNCTLSELKIPHGEKIKKLVIGDCQALEKLDLSQFPNLEELSLSTPTMLESLDLSMCHKLKRVKLDLYREDGADVSINVRGLKLLESVELMLYNRETEVPDFSESPVRNLTIGCSSARLLDLSKYSVLENFSYTTESGLRIRANGLSKLKKVHVQHAEFYDKPCDIELTNNSALQELSVKTVSSARVNISNSSQVRVLKLDAESKSSLHIQGLENCQQLNCMEINAKNAAEIVSLVKSPDCHILMAKDAPEQKYLSLMQYNNNSTVSLNAYPDDESLDADTALSMKPTDYSSAFSLTLEEKQPVDRDHYRQQICEGFSLDEKNKKITVSYAVDEKDVACKLHDIKQFPLVDRDVDVIKKAVLQDSKEGVGYFKGPFAPGKLYALATQHAMEKDSLLEIYSDPPNAAKIFFHERHKQFYLQAPSDQPAQTIKILYRYKRNAVHKEQPKGEPFESKTPLLPPMIAEELKKEIESNPDLAFLLDVTKTKREKLALIEAYCKGFTNTELKATSTNDIEALIAIIHERKGACRHRSQAFMALAHVIGVPVRLIGNEQHAFCEVVYPSGLHRADLGGAPSIDITPADRRRNVFAQKDEKDEKHIRVVAPVIAPEKEIETPHQQALRDLFTNEFKTLSGITPLTSWNALFAPLDLHPVLEVSSNDEISRARNQLIAELRKNHTPYLDIRGPEDLKHYFECYDFKGNRRVPSAGPLQTILQNGGVLLIDWSAFTAAEIANYKSLIDRDDANLFGKSVSAQVRSIGFIKNDTESCGAFISRCKKYHIDAALLKKDEVKEKAKTEVKARDPIIVNLYHQPSWHDRLLGRVEAKRDGLHFIDGPLLQAIKQNRPLHILNPPNDPEFNTLLDRIRQEHRIFVGSQEIEVSGDVVITVEERIFEAKSSHINLQYEDSEKLAEPSHRVFIGTHNWHELFKRTVIEKQEALPASGFLDDPKETKSVFYVTNSIDKSDWEMLVDHLEKNPPSTQLQFRLAPGVKIEGLPPNKAVSQPLDVKAFKHGTPSLLVSNDVGLLTDEIAKENKNTLVVNLIPNMSYQDLIASISQKQDEKTGQIDFQYEEKYLLKALQEGQTVVLKGNLSPKLYQRLRPLLSDPPHIYSNGERINVRGKLICVMPTVGLNQFPFHPVHRRNYADQDYQECFAKEDRHLVQAIQHYIACLNWLPQHKTEPQVLTYERLKNMIVRLKNPTLREVHSHNPLKEFFLEFYPKGEKNEDAKQEEYAYMNVLGKFLIRPDDDSPRRQKKLIKLCERLDVRHKEDLKKYLWRILNCLNGNELHRILGDDLLRVIRHGQGMPAVSEEIIENLQKHLSVFLEEKVKEPEKKFSSAADKTKHHIELFMQVEDSRILIFTGMPGRGKTHAVDELKKSGTVYRGRNEADLLAWLTASGDCPRYLELSEYNMTPEGTWDFLEGIKNRKIFYKGQEYPLSPNHWIIATGNPPGFEGRCCIIRFSPFSHRAFYDGRRAGDEGF